MKNLKWLLLPVCFANSSIFLWIGFTDDCFITNATEDLSFLLPPLVPSVRMPWATMFTHNTSKWHTITSQHPFPHSIIGWPKLLTFTLTKLWGCGLFGMTPLFARCPTEATSHIALLAQVGRSSVQHDFTHCPMHLSFYEVHFHPNQYVGSFSRSS